MRISSAIRAGGALALTALLVGCASGPKSLYSWNGYQTQVYSYLKSDGPAPEDQILELEKGPPAKMPACPPATRRTWICCT